MTPEDPLEVLKWRIIGDIQMHKRWAKQLRESGTSADAAMATMHDAQEMALTRVLGYIMEQQKEQK